MQGEFYDFPILFRYPQTVSLICPVSPIVTISDDPSSLASVLQAMHPADAASRPQELSLASIQPQVCDVHCSALCCRLQGMLHTVQWTLGPASASVLAARWSASLPHFVQRYPWYTKHQNIITQRQHCPYNFVCLYFNILILIKISPSTQQYIFSGTPLRKE